MTNDSPLVRPLRWALSGILLLAACTPTPAPESLQDHTLNLGLAQDGWVRQSTFDGGWTVKDVPSWLSVRPTSGSGTVEFQVTAHRVRATPITADQAQLQGKLVIASKDSPDMATVTVTADQYSLSGRVRDAPVVNGPDSGGGERNIVVSSARAPQGVIVGYRTQDAGSSAPGLSAQALRDHPASQRGAQVLRQAGVPVWNSRGMGQSRAVLVVDDVSRALKVLRADPDVAYAVPNHFLRQQGEVMPALEPTDQYAGLQWPYRLVGYPAVWRDMEAGEYTRPVTVAVIDSGVRFDHPDLVGQLWTPGEGALDVLDSGVETGQPFENGDEDGPDLDPTDPSTPGRTADSHGTHVTGLIVARWGNNTETCRGCSATGVVGASYRAPVKVLPVRAIDVSGYATTADVIAATEYAAGVPIELNGVVYKNPHPAQVINLSLGGTMPASEAKPLCDAVKRATLEGALVVVAAGNSGNTVPYFPAACEGAVAVASVTLSGASAPERATYSNAYAAVQLAAPGGSSDYSRAFNGAILNGLPYPDQVFSTDWNYVKNEPTYNSMMGTSQAAPQVSALAALILSKGMTTTAQEALQRMQVTATDLGVPGRDEQFGFGMINAAAALNAPQVSDTLGLRLQDASGRAYQPALDALGRFHAYLGEGSYTLVGGRDWNLNGVFGEVNEPRAETAVTLGASQPSVSLPDLVVR